MDAAATPGDGSGARRRPRPLLVDALCARGQARRRCSRSMPSMPRSPRFATASASRCPARSGCNGGATPSPTARPAAIRSPRRCLQRSAATTCRKTPFDDYLEARIFDLYDDPMPGRAELEGYCGETASALIQLAALILDAGAAPAARRSRRPCRLRAGDHRADPAAPAASRARPMLRAARHPRRRRHVAGGVRRRRAMPRRRAAPSPRWLRWRRASGGVRAPRRRHCRNRCGRPSCRWR